MGSQRIALTRRDSPITRNDEGGVREAPGRAGSVQGGRRQSLRSPLHFIPPEISGWLQLSA